MTELEAKAIAKALRKADFRNFTGPDTADAFGQWCSCINQIVMVLRQNVVLFDSEQFRQECGQYD